MELLLASAIGALAAVGLYLMLQRESFPLVLGLTFLSYGVNLFLFVMGRLAVSRPPILAPAVAAYTDPLPQALVLTAIVISFGMTALLLALSVRLRYDSGTDHVDGDGDPNR